MRVPHEHHVVVCAGWRTVNVAQNTVEAEHRFDTKFDVNFTCNRMFKFFVLRMVWRVQSL